MQLGRWTTPRRLAALDLLRLALAISPVFLGCSAPTTQPDDGGASALVMQGRRLSLTAGDTTSIGLTWLRNGQVVERTASTGSGPAWTQSPATVWGSDDDGVAAVSAAGVVTARAPGMTWIRAKRGSIRDSSPVTVAFARTTAEGIASVTAGGGHTCALTRDGVAWCWGDTWNAATGTGVRSRYSGLVSPTRVATTERFVRIAAGADHTCAMNALGAVWCWGDNRFGQIGSGNLYEASPWRIALPFAAIAVSVGGDAACAVVVDGTLRCWGTRFSISRAYSTGTAARFDDVSVGAFHACAHSTAGDVWCWGDNQNGALGTGDKLVRTVPAQVAFSAKFTQVSAGNGFTCAIDVASQAWCWGAGTSGELGQDDDFLRTSPGLVPVPVPLHRISAGGGHTCSSAVDGSIYCWGGNLYGALGNGPPLKSDPTAADLIFRSPVRVLAQEQYGTAEAGGGVTCAITRATSRLDCWGANTNGQLGIGHTSWISGRRYSQRDIPAPVAQFAP